MIYISLEKWMRHKSECDKCDTEYAKPIDWKVAEKRQNVLKSFIKKTRLQIWWVPQHFAHWIYIAKIIIIEIWDAILI